jgi:hypothetical protein
MLETGRCLQCGARPEADLSRASDTTIVVRAKPTCSCSQLAAYAIPCACGGVVTCSPYEGSYDRAPSVNCSHCRLSVRGDSSRTMDSAVAQWNRLQILLHDRCWTSR